jgi:hypothetical protein
MLQALHLNIETNIDMPEILRHIIVSAFTADVSFRHGYPDRKESFSEENNREMEDLEKRVIEDLPVVSSVGFHAGDKTHKADVYANLRCCAA